MKMKVFGWFPEDQGAGWYTSVQTGAYEDRRIEMYFICDDQDAPQDQLPAFSYWHEDTPVCDNYLKH